MSNSLQLHGQSMEFSRPEYWSGLYFPSPGDPPNPGIEPRSPALQEDSLAAESQAKPSTLCASVQKPVRETKCRKHLFMDQRETSVVVSAKQREKGIHVQAKGD